MHTVSIHGCCVSRDLFNSKFVPDYKDYFELKSYAHQPSMISVMSSCIPYECSSMSGKSPSVLDKGQFEAELEKNFRKTLLINDPDVLIIDLYGDVMYGALKVGRSYILGKDFRFRHYRTYKRLKISKRYYPRDNFDEFFPLWQKKTNLFFEFMKTYLPGTQIILNGAKAKKYYKDEDGSLKEFETLQDVDQINEIWNRLDRYILDHYPVDFLDFSNDEYYLNPDHIFGSYIVHFDQKYYDLYFDKLRSVVKEPHEKHPYLQNVIFNSTLKYGKAFWSYWDDQAVLDKENKKIIFDEQGNEKRVKRHCWSCAAEINGDGKTPYRLSMRVKFRNVDDNKKFFCVRTFNKKDDVQYTKCIKSYDFYLDKYGLEPEKEQTFEYIIYPKGKYVKVAPFLNKNGYIEYSKISLRRVKTINSKRIPEK